MTTSFPPGVPIDRFDVVRVPFIFSDLTKIKTRPAVVLSPEEEFNRPSRHVLVAMVTSASHSSFPLDVSLVHPLEAGLLKPCLIRMKLMTLAATLILEKIGTLQSADRRNVSAALSAFIPQEHH